MKRIPLMHVAAALLLAACGAAMDGDNGLAASDAPPEPLTTPSTALGTTSSSPTWSYTPGPFPTESPQLGESFDRARARSTGPVVEPDLYAAQAAILRQPSEHVGEQVAMYVYVDQEGGHCPDGFLGQVLLGVVKPPRGVEWEFTGGNWGLYDKSQEVRFVVNWPDDGVVRPLCDDPGDLYKEVMLVRASVLDESSPTFFVNSMQSQGELIDEVS